jgi:hypothetical protein
VRHRSPTAVRGNRAFGACLCAIAGFAAGTAVAFDLPLIPWAPTALTCARLATPPVLDGRPDEPAWFAAPWSGPFTDIRGPLADPPRHLTRVRLGWDADYLYVGARLDEPHVWATLTERDAVIYHDNDFEVFIDPDGDNHLYGELEINALGTVWDLLLARPYRDGGPAIDAWDIAGLRSAVAVDGTLNDPGDVDRGWSVEIAIPWRVLAPLAGGRACPPLPGDVWRLNFSRVQWRTEIVDGAYRKLVDAGTGRPLPEDNWVWSPQGLIAMHCPEMWGHVVFDDGSGHTVEGSADQGRFRLATLLMPLYYRQQQLREASGRYAADLDALGLAAGQWPGWPGDRGGQAWAAPLPAGWVLTLRGDDDGYRATLATPAGTAAIDHTGRLEVPR